MKHYTRWYIVLALVLMSVEAVLFLVPITRGSVFWISQVFIALAVIAQAFVMRIAFRLGGTTKSKYYGWPIVRVGLMYLATILLVGGVLIAVSNFVALPVWATILTYLLITTFYSIGFIAAEDVRDHVEAQDWKMREMLHNMTGFVASAERTAQRCEDPALKKQLESFAEEMRYSDPVSSPKLAQIEGDIREALAQLDQCVENGATEEAAKRLRELKYLLDERNRMCIAMK